MNLRRSKMVGKRRRLLPLVGRAMRWLLLLPVLLLMTPVLLVWAVGSGARDALRRRRFRAREAGNFYLVCTRRRGWNEFVENNVQPVLPPNVEIAFCRRSRNAAVTKVSELLGHRVTWGVQKPFLVGIERKGLRVVHCHRDLLVFKRHHAKNDPMRNRVRQLIEQKLAGFESHAAL